MALEKLGFKRRPTHPGTDYYEITEDVVDFITSARGHLLVANGDVTCYLG